MSTRPVSTRPVPSRWRLRFHPSEAARTWQRSAKGERRTARLLGRLTRDGYVVFHDLAVPGSPANVDHLVIGASGVFVIDSKQWTGSVHQGADGLVWHNHYRLDRTLETVRWDAEMISRVLGTRTAALQCVHGAHVQHGGLHGQGVAIMPAHLLRGALGYDRVLSDADVTALAITARRGASAVEAMRGVSADLARGSFTPIGAAFADRVLFLRDGLLVDALQRPTADGVVARMAVLEA